MRSLSARLHGLSLLVTLLGACHGGNGGADAGQDGGVDGSAIPDGASAADGSGGGGGPDLASPVDLGGNTDLNSSADLHSSSADLGSGNADLRSSSPDLFREPDLRSSPDLLVCAPHNFDSENFDSGTPAAITSGPVLLSWCHPYIPPAFNTPLCEMGRTLRNNGGDQLDGPPGIWLSRGATGCSSATLSYTYYQFAAAGVTLGYQQSNDSAPQCPTTEVALTTAATHSTLQQCDQKTVSIPFGAASSVYIFFQHDNSSMNAIWIDNLSITLNGCAC